MLVVQFDLSNTAFMRDDVGPLMPDHCELFAIALALMVSGRRTMRDLVDQPLDLNDGNIDIIAHLIADRFPLFVPRATGFAAIRDRISWYEGLAVTAFDCGQPAEVSACARPSEEVWA